MPSSLDARTQTISSIRLFAGLPHETMQRIAELAGPFEVPAGHVLIEANQAGSGMFVIEEGVVEVQTRGRRIELGAGEEIGELALLTAQGLRSARVQAKTPVRCLALARDDFQALLAEDHALALWLLQTVARRLSDS
jgi:CRP-like cAMP-binding protein